MRFDLVDLQLFVAVAETRSITNGAAKVHLALASASERIKGLEGALGVSLLTRGRRGVEHALADNIERMPFSEDRLVLVAARDDELANRRQVNFGDVVKRDFVGLISSIALHAHISGHAARLGARLRFRARLNSFDAIGQMVAAGIGIGVMPEVAAKRCARSMKINVVRIRESWANRKLVICARSFRALPKPAQQLAEHLRKSAPR